MNLDPILVDFDPRYKISVIQAIYYNTYAILLSSSLSAAIAKGDWKAQNALQAELEKIRDSLLKSLQELGQTKVGENNGE